MKSLERAKIPVRFVTNETQKTRKSLVEMLHSLGYVMRLEQVFPPALAMASIIKSSKVSKMNIYEIQYFGVQPFRKTVSLLSGTPEMHGGPD